jgi:hypothetical protein
MPQPPSPKNEERCLLRRVLGIRLESDGSLKIPLRHTWKAFSRTEFFAFWIVLPYGAIMSDKPARDAAHFGTYLLAASALYLGLSLSLVVRRGLSTRLYSGVGVLEQRSRSYSLSTTGAVLGSTRRRHEPFVLLGGVQFPLVAGVFTGKEERLAAVQVLREWITAAPETHSNAPNGVAAFLALADVTSVEGDTIRLQAIWSNFASYVYLACAIIPLAAFFMLPMLVAFPSDFAFAFNIMLVFTLLISLGLAVFLQKSKPTVAITTGKWLEVLEHGNRFTCPPWQSQFDVGRPNPYDEQGPVYPYIYLKYGQRVLTVHSSRMYEADELEDFAERMNHFLWAGHTQPTDPAAQGALIAGK